MSVYFYLTTNTNRNEPDAIKAVDFIHVKAKADGSQTAIICDTQVNDSNCEEMTKDELQAVLNGWISDENQSPGTNEDGSSVFQNPIDLGAYLA